MRILSRTALRAVRSHGVSERELDAMGGHPESVLRYIRGHGDPPACAGFAAALRDAR